MDPLQVALAVASASVAMGAAFGGIRYATGRLETKATEQEKTLQSTSTAHATLRVSHDELHSKHDALASESRNRMSLLEGRVTATEQANIETKLQLQHINAQLVRVEAKQDRDAEAIDKLRHEIPQMTAQVVNEIRSLKNE